MSVLKGFTVVLVEKWEPYLEKGDSIRKVRPYLRGLNKKSETLIEKEGLINKSWTLSGKGGL